MAYTKLAFRDKGFGTSIENIKVNCHLWLHPSLDTFSLIAIGYQISSPFISIFKAEITRNYMLEYGSFFTD